MRSPLALAILVAIPAFAADWNPKAAADYMDARQKLWVAWPRANLTGAACVSCHTQLAYMLVRPELRRVLGESQPTEYELGFSKMMRSRADAKAPAEDSAMDRYGTESVLYATLLTAENSPDAAKAIDRMWSAQLPDGGWRWFSLNDDPWEMPESRFFGAALGAVAAGTSGNKPAEHVDRLARFLSHDEGQPFHNRLMLLWASKRLPEVLPAARKKAILDQARQTQQPDGGWTMASLGPWRAHTAAPVSEGSNAYATALVAFNLEQGGLTASDPMLGRALQWLRAHQNPDGYWDAPSMNHKYEAGSMMELFMRDAATAYASLALLDAGQVSVDGTARP
jgi:squalene-hopene/tetraprenyl-beta-curcumene cyclase